MLRRRRLSVESLETRLVPSTVNLHQGDNLQKAIHAANPGDVLLLDAGATFLGTYTLEAKSNPSLQPITITTNLFPLAPGVRVGPSNASAMAQIQAPGLNLPAIQTQAGANYYTLRGLNILPTNARVLADTLVTIGDGSSAQASLSTLPNNIILDQCYIHGWDGQGIKRGVALNDGGTGSKSGVYNSYVSNFKLVGQDSQAIAGWNGTGPYTIQNNYLEAAGENLLFGGAYSYIQQVPSNITITNNTFSKPLSWKPKDPSFAGVTYTVKNLLEFKSAQKVTIDGNLFQNNWGGSQDGHAILITPRGLQSGGSWVTVSNVTFTHNTVQNVDQGLNILGSDDLSASQAATNILIQDNVFSNVGYPTPGKNGQVFTLQAGRNGGIRNLVIDHNTITVAYTDMLVMSAHYGFQFTNNLMPQGTYGMIVGGLGSGMAALAKAFPDGVITGNVIVGGQALYYPSGNFFPKSWDQTSQYASSGARSGASGNGSGAGSGTGDGSGSGSGSNSGTGSNSGSGSGSGSGTGTGSGSGTNDDTGSGTGDGAGSGSGTGNGSGTGDGSGSGTGDGSGSGPGSGTDSTPPPWWSPDVPWPGAGSGSGFGSTPPPWWPPGFPYP